MSSNQSYNRSHINEEYDENIDYEYKARKYEHKLRQLEKQGRKKNQIQNGGEPDYRYLIKKYKHKIKQLKKDHPNIV